MKSPLLEHPESVVIVALDGAHVVVVVQPRPGAAEPTVELPAGCIEPGEDPLTCAQRELREECSLAARSWRALGSFYAAPSYSTEFVHAFEARELTPSAGEPDEDEEITVDRRAVADLPGVLSDATSMAGFALWAATTARP